MNKKKAKLNRCLFPTLSWPLTATASTRPLNTSWRSTASPPWLDLCWEEPAWPLLGPVLAMWPRTTRCSSEARVVREASCTFRCIIVFECTLRLHSFVIIKQSVLTHCLQWKTYFLCPYFNHQFVLQLLFPRNIVCYQRRGFQLAILPCDCTSTIMTSWDETAPGPVFTSDLSGSLVVVSLQEALTAWWRWPPRRSCSVLCSRLRRRTMSATRDRTPVGLHSLFFSAVKQNVSEPGREQRNEN